MPTLAPLRESDRFGFTMPIRWECGFRHVGGQLYRLVATQEGMEVAAVPSAGAAPEWAVVVTPALYSVADLEGRGPMASKWITQAIKASGKGGGRALRIDPFLGAGRPALSDFMTEIEGPGGAAREASVLMICCTPGGVRIGLKDEDAGGWCWREGDTVAAALDAIEQALQAATGAFRSAGGGRKGRKQ